MIKKIIKYGIRIVSFVIIIAVIVIVVKSVQNTGYGFGEKGIVDYPKGLKEISVPEGSVLENEYTALYIDENYSISLLDKATGKTWSSSLSGEAQEYFNVSEDMALSACTVDYLSDSNTVTPYASYTQSVKKNQSKLYLTDNGVRITFIFGERKSDDIIPKALTEERFNEILLKLDNDQQDFLKRRYELFSLDTISNADNPEEKVETFAALKTRPLYIISDVSGKVIVTKTKELFENIGYTREDYLKDNELTGYQVDTTECVFKISYDLRLDGRDLVVTVPKSEISFYSEYPMLSVSPLKFFTSSYGKTGEIVVPIGSGSVMSFGTDNIPMSFKSRFYGDDSSEIYEQMPSQMLSANECYITMPVYFFTEEDTTMMVVVESGAEAGTFHIERDKASTYAYTTFDIVQNGYSYLTDKKKALVCGSDSIASDIVIRYRSLSTSGYVSDAKEYKNYLLQNGMLTDKSISENPLFLLETIGTVENKSGKLITLSYCQDIENMISELSNGGKSRISVKMLGMNKNGFLKQIPGEFVYNTKIDGSGDLDSIKALAEKTGGKAYFQLNHLFYYNHTSFDGYSLSNNNAKKIDKSWAIIGKYDPVEGTYSSSDKETWVLSPKTYQATVEKYLKFGFDSIGIGDFACRINSDYSNKHYYDRSNSLNCILASLKEYKKSNVYLAAINANSYALLYVDLIEEMPNFGSNSTLFDSSVPFCQIVLHGKVDYTSQAINYFSDPETAVLKAIEYGSGLHFCLNENIDLNIFDTKYTALYSTSYEENRKFAISSSEKVTEALGGLNDKEIVSHVKADNVSVTYFEDGTRIYVNYNDKAVIVDGFEIPAKGYLRK